MPGDVGDGAAEQTERAAGRRSSAPGTRGCASRLDDASAQALRQIGRQRLHLGKFRHGTQCRPDRGCSCAGSQERLTVGRPGSLRARRRGLERRRRRHVDVGGSARRPSRWGGCASATASRRTPGCRPAGSPAHPTMIVGTTPIPVDSRPARNPPIGITPQTMKRIDAFMRPSRARRADPLAEADLRDVVDQHRDAEEELAGDQQRDRRAPGRNAASGIRKQRDREDQLGQPGSRDPRRSASGCGRTGSPRADPPTAPADPIRP